MSCKCCENPYKICITLCNVAHLITLIEKADESVIYYLELEYLGGIKKFSQLQVAGTNIYFSFLPNELNEDYCYTGHVYYYDTGGVKTDLIINSNGIEYDCLQICTNTTI
ncbi:MAG: hypothetical protein ACEQSR_08580 [Candidatus Methylacidiphilales bacterium]